MLMSKVFSLGVNFTSIWCYVFRTNVLIIECANFFNTHGYNLFIGVEMDRHIDLLIIPFL